MARPSRLLAVLFCAFATTFAVAQSTPPPSGAFVPPITGYVGRYLDSGQTRLFQAPNRTLRAQLVKVAEDRGLILMKLSGSLFGVYRLGTFATRVSTEPLSIGAHGERFLPPDVFSVNPESPGSGWNTIMDDGQERLTDFDYDARGYFYLAYSIWGFGIVDSAGVLKAQVNPVALGVGPVRIITVPVGNSVFVVISNGQTPQSVTYDVTNPTAPQFQSALPFGFTSYAKLGSGGVAAITTDGQLRVWASGSDLVLGGTPQTFAPQPGFFYTHVTTDGTALFAAQRTNPLLFPFATVVSKLTGAPGSFTETRYAPLAGFVPVDLHYGAGYVVISGATFPTPGNRSVYVYRSDSSTPSDLTPYFTAAYPPASFIGVESMAPYASGGQTYLIAALIGVGDLFTLAAAPSIPAFSFPGLLIVALALGTIALLRLR